MKNTNGDIAVSEKPKKERKAINTLVIIVSIVCFACLLTWIIPAGQYDRIQNEAGATMVDPGSFHFVERSPVNPLMIPLHIVNGAINYIDLLMVLLTSGAAFTILIKTGAMHSSIGAIALKYRKRKMIFVLVMLCVFSVICITQSIVQFVAFTPIIVMICLSLGLDTITAVSVMVFGSAIGFATGMLQPSTTLIAQSIAELPPFSGIGYRFICFICFLVVTGFLLARYVQKVSKDPTVSVMYEFDKDNPMSDPELIHSFGHMTLRKWLIVLTLVIAMIVIAFGTVKLGWRYTELSAVFIGLAIIGGFCAGMTPTEIANGFVEGAKSMVMVFFLVASARGIASILTEGNILDTIVFGLGSVLQVVPSAFQKGIAMFLANFIINIGIPSGSGQAGAVMPIMIPLADLIGMTRQTAILAFNFGDGLCNWIIPTSSALMAILGIAKVPYERWVKYVFGFFIWWVPLACVLIVIAQIIKLGPF